MNTRHPLRCYLVVVIASLNILLLATTRADDAVNCPVETLLSRISQPQDSDDLRIATEVLWDNDIDIHSLLLHEHLSVSLRAAWRRVITTASRSEASDASYSFSEVAANRCTGFIEGRIRVALPEWWVNALTKTRLTTQFEIECPFDEIPRYPPSATGFQSSANAHLDHTNEGVVLIVDEITIEVPRGGSSAVDCISVTRNEEVLFLAEHSDRSRSYPLICVSTDGNERWHAVVWGFDNDSYFGGRGSHFVELTVSDGAVYVFGACNDGVYLEAFALESGENLFRFNTSY